MDKIFKNAKITAEDVFTAFYNAFHRLEHINPGITPEENEVAQKEVAKELNESSQLLEKYIDARIKRIIFKMKDAGDLK